MNSDGSVSHSNREEAREALARWFQSLSVSERMEVACAFTDLALAINPALKNGKYVRPVPGRIQVITAEREIDLEDARLLDLEEDEEPGKPSGS